MCRIVAALLLLTLAAVSCAATSSTPELDSSNAWVHRLQKQLGSHWRLLPVPTSGSGRHAGSTVGSLAANPADRQHPSLLQLSLELPNGKLVQVREDATLEEVVQMLVAAQVGWGEQPLLAAAETTGVP
jgi:hypothetical protein